MKLKSKFQNEEIELGEVVTAIFLSSGDCITVQTDAKKGGRHTFFYHSIEEFNNDWEDAPEEYYYICHDGEVRSDADDLYTEDCKLIGNYFSTKAEVELAVEKLKAWKRLKDAGVKFDGWERYGDLIEIRLLDLGGDIEIDDLTFLFGGEE